MNFRGLALTTIRRLERRPHKGHRTPQVWHSVHDALVWRPGVSEEADSLWAAHPKSWPDVEPPVGTPAPDRRYGVFDVIWERIEESNRMGASKVDTEDSHPVEADGRTGPSTT